MDNKEIPEGATHYHEGSGRFHPHYIKIVDGVHYTWLTGFVGGDNWNLIPSIDRIENYKQLEQGK